MLGSSYLPYYLGSFDMNYIISEMLKFSKNCLFFFFFPSKEIFVGKENRELFLHGNFKKKKLFTTDESALNMQVEEDKSQT
jgi:hypothetical protein